MGKSKSHKPSVKNNIFKVAGCKSLKAKNKAKSVTAKRLKQLNYTNEKKINNIDEQLVNLNVEVRQPPKEPAYNSDKTRKIFDCADKQEIIRKFNETEENCHQALSRFCSMEM